MQVFVTGATGYIGFAVATALRRAGHHVYGLARSDAKARHLEVHEIEPVRGELGDPRAYADVAARCAAVIHTAFEYSADGVAKDRAAVEALIAATRRGGTLERRTFVYTSGAWVYGDTGGRTVDETAPLAPTTLVAWRPAHERIVLEAEGVRGIVLRPGDVYGGAGGLTVPWFAEPAAGRPPSVVGDGRSRWPMVHVADLAECYVRAAESARVGEVFNVADGSRFTTLEMARAAGRAAGWTGDVRLVPLAEARKTMGDLADALALDQQVDAGKAARLLGWRPRHAGFVPEVDLYYRGWRARQD